jgi:UDP-N-acetyl-2-amino-2-deoxyglucuronate dehydrogenase
VAGLGVGICGAGWVAGEYVKAFTRNPHTEVRGVFSRTRASAERLASAHGAQARTYETLEDMLRADGIDIVVLSSPPRVHARQAVAAARAGKHLVIEKPVALHREEVSDLLDAVTRAGVRSVVSFVLRWNPMFRTIKQLMADGTVGRVMYAEADYWHWVGPHYGQFSWSHLKAEQESSLLSAGCHAMDALRWFAGEVEEVFAVSAPGFTGSVYEYHPNMVGTLRFTSGAIGKVSSLLECRTPYIFNIQIFGEKGTIRNNRVYAPHRFPGATNYLEYPTVLPDSGDVTHHPFQAEVDEFVTCVREGGSTSCELADAARTMEVCFALDESAASGRPVKVRTL